jgi:nucleoside-diphosphate-sugar epimerase
MQIFSAAGMIRGSWAFVSPNVGADVTAPGAARSGRRTVFITGGTGFVGRALVRALLARGHDVHALVRRGSERRLPPGCHAVPGDVLDPDGYAATVQPGDVFVHLAAVAHPSPSKAKARQFRDVDLAGTDAAARVARARNACRFVYVSVAQPAPVMKAYVAARMAGEVAVIATGLPASILRPWYVLGPGRRWPLLLLPLYTLARLFPRGRATARRLGLLRRADMVTSLLAAVEARTDGVSVLDVPAMKALGARGSAAITPSRTRAPFATPRRRTASR